jgi:ribosomal protein S18 acetylase RimI-like enzyme
VQVQIRAYHERDHAAGLVLWEEMTQWHREIYQDPSIGGPTPGQHFETFLANPALRRLWVAQADDKVVGLAGLLVHGEQGEIEEVVVLPAYRRRGIGSRLIQTAVEAAKELNLQYLCIRPTARNVDALRLYASLGFRLVGQIELFQDLRPQEGRVWKDGLRIFDTKLGY